MLEKEKLGGIGLPEIKEEVQKQVAHFEQLQQDEILLQQASQSALPHAEILQHLLDQIGEVDFRALAGLTGSKEKLQQKHYVVNTVDYLLKLAADNKWGLARQHNSIYLYNGAHWSIMDKDDVSTFLANAARKMGVDRNDSLYHQFRDQLFKQFLSVSSFSKIAPTKGTVLINLGNGTFEITPGQQFLRNHRREDFLTYLLPFDYNDTATAPTFQHYLDRVLPDISCQKVLAEFLGYVFISTSTLKLEKVLMLYGSGANGKSVFYEITQALFGRNNTGSYGLDTLTDAKGYSRAQLNSLLVNYASEITGGVQTDMFKLLASGERIEARLPYGEPFVMEDYAKLIFNCNELPRKVENTPAYFRRFLIIPFSVTIPEEEQDKELAGKIIGNELSGVFNWVIAGLKRLLEQKRFTDCDAAQRELDAYKIKTDNVKQFLADEGYEYSPTVFISVEAIHQKYCEYCKLSGYHALGKANFKERMEGEGFTVKKKNYGYAFPINKIKE